MERGERQYIGEALRRMLEAAVNDGVKSIAMPAIGAGLGGLAWEDVKSVIDDVGAGFPDVDLYVVVSYSPVTVKP